MDSDEERERALAFRAEVYKDSGGNWRWRLDTTLSVICDSIYRSFARRTAAPFGPGRGTLPGDLLRKSVSSGSSATRGEAVELRERQAQTSRPVWPVADAACGSAEVTAAVEQRSCAAMQTVRALRLGALTARHLRASSDELEALVSRERRRAA